MTSYSGPKDSTPADDSTANWGWLRKQLDDRPASLEFCEWVTEQVQILEDDFADLITPKSRTRGLCKELQRDTSNSD